MGHGKNVDPEHAKTLYALYQSNPEAAKALCAHYGYKKSTFYKIISNEGNIHSIAKISKPKKWSQEMINLLIQFVELNPQATLEQIHDYFVGNQNFPEISLYTLWKYLDDMLITLKRVSIKRKQSNIYNYFLIYININLNMMKRI